MREPYACWWGETQRMHAYVPIDRQSIGFLTYRIQVERNELRQSSYRLVWTGAEHH